MILNGVEVSEIVLSRQDGHLYNALALMPEDMPIEEIAHNLSHINRYGGAQPKPVSVGLHSILVSYLVPETYAYEALMHDATEAIVGDMMHPVKAHCQTFRDIEAAVHRQLSELHGMPLLESAIVKEADMRARELECVYRRGGNLAATPHEIQVCRDVLARSWSPAEVALGFLMRYDDCKLLSLQWH